MMKIVAKVEWCVKNYAGGWGYPGIGAIISTGKTLEEFKDDFKDAVEFHLDGMTEDGDNLPQWAVDRDYEIEFELAITAILHEVEKFTTLKAISKASGIKLPTLKQYASGDINPKEAQCEKIINAIRVIAQNLMDLTLA